MQVISKVYMLLIAAAICPLNVATTAMLAKADASQVLIAEEANQPVLQFNAPDSSGAPGTQQDPPSSGGSRPGCPGDASLIALGPTNNWGETISARPTFWLRIPYASSMEFLLQDETTKSILYRQAFPVSEGPGIIHFQIPENFNLEIDRQYRWRFDFFCNPISQASYLSVEGVVVRRNQDFSLEELSAYERVFLYAGEGLWHDALTETGRLRLVGLGNENSLIIWHGLLSNPSVILSTISDEAILSCCGN